MSSRDIHLLPNQFIQHLLHELTTRSAIDWSAPDEVFDTWADWWEYNFDISNVRYLDIMRYYVLTNYNHELGRVDSVHSLEYISHLVEELGLDETNDGSAIIGVGSSDTVSSLQPCTRAFITRLRVEFEERLGLENTLLYWENVLRQELEDIIGIHLRRQRQERWDARLRWSDAVLRRGVNRNGYQRHPEWMRVHSTWVYVRMTVRESTRRWGCAVELVGWVLLILNG